LEIAENPKSRPHLNIPKMKNSKNHKLAELNVETVTELSVQEMQGIKGGFLSIGHACSHRTKCDRLWTKCWGDVNGGSPGGECEHDDILNAQG
tara:strand:- start:637 stop:915 length:279 start_codon:yes stop_codon:yes gene_type:complete